MTDPNQEYSRYRESLIEKRFLNDLLNALWPEERVEVLRPEVDFAGYDLVLEARKQTRHIQLKSSAVDPPAGKKGPGEVTVSGRLGDKSAGCVLWMEVADDDLEPRGYRWFGGEPGEPLPDLSRFRAARTTKADASGTKKERRNVYVVPKRAFEELSRLEDVIEKLFGPKKDPKN